MPESRSIEYNRSVYLCAYLPSEGVSSLSVELRPGESQDSILRRFRKAVAEARILPIVRQKRWFTSKSEIRRIKRQKAIRKSQRMMMEQQQQ